MVKVPMGAGKDKAAFQCDSIPDNLQQTAAFPDHSGHPHPTPRHDAVHAPLTGSKDKQDRRVCITGGSSVSQAITKKRGKDLPPLTV